MSEFKNGQIVRLKSGGPKMTIKGADDGDFDTPVWACQWFDRNGKLHHDSFPEDMLDVFIDRG
ncbi:YodC family protein [Litorimonas sp. RW-G-Af-16]|uniref:YodC family protein n=1 Tax=Litorimonas sp. RW-G-Af-16 TaxID=3241168 RepID=UPI00390C484A